MSNYQRTLQGTVVKISGINSISVRVERKQQHPLYGKVVRTHRKYLVHSHNTQDFKPGDIVIIAETRPMSKNKSWKVLSKVNTEK
jgi:small subunit ribosomal protein S17